MAWFVRPAAKRARQVSGLGTSSAPSPESVADEEHCPPPRPPKGFKLSSRGQGHAFCARRPGAAPQTSCLLTNENR